MSKERLLKKDLEGLLRKGHIYKVLESADTVDDLREIEAYLMENDSLNPAILLVQSTISVVDKLYEVEDEDFRYRTLVAVKRIDPFIADTAVRLLGLEV